MPQHLLYHKTQRNNAWLGWCRMKKLFYLFLFLLLASCSGNTVYDHYNHTSVLGWDRGEVLTYDVPRMKQEAKYATSLGLRVSGAYPFQSLTLIVEQTVIPGRKTTRDTLNCQIYDSKGTVKGEGISYFQYHFLVSEKDLKQGDSLHVTVRHDMRREIIPGVSDIGIQVVRN